MVGRDKIEDLSALWGRLQAPAPDDAGCENAKRSGAALEWMRAAWGSIETPPVVMPSSHLGHRTPKTFTGQVLVLVGALAASALCLLTLVPRKATELNSERRPPGQASTVSTVPELVPEELLTKEPPLAAYTPNAFELRSGSVRLILLEDPTDTVFEDPQILLPNKTKQQETDR